MKKFEELNFKSNFEIINEGMEISCHIAGVKSRAYSLPFVITVRTWAKKWFFRKFFVRQMKLSLWQMKQLRNELDKAINYIEKEKYD